MKTNPFLSAIATAVLGLTTTLAMNAQAVTFDAKAYPGAGCQAVTGSQESSFSHQANGIFNNSATATMTVACPIVRDNTINTNGLAKMTTGASGMMVFVDNQGAAGSLKCLLSSNDKFGTLVASNSAASPVGLNTLNLSVSVSAVPGHYILTCDLPPKSSVRGYQVNEFLNTDSDS